MALLAAVLLCQADVDELYRGAWALWQQGKWVSAQEKLERVLILEPHHLQARLLLGFAPDVKGWRETLEGVPRRKCIVAVRKGLRLPKAEIQNEWAAKSPHHARVVKILCSPDTWVQALWAVHERTGLFEDTIDIDVQFVPPARIDRKQLAVASGVDGRGYAQFNVERLAAYYRAKEEGLDDVPAKPLPSIVAHEAGHVFQNVTNTPEWFCEGMACYVAGNTIPVDELISQNIPIRGIDLTTREQKEVYGRGLCFFLWMESSAGKAQLKEFMRLAVKHKIDARKAAEKILGKRWEQIVREERLWSEAFVKGHKAK